METNKAHIKQQNSSQCDLPSFKCTECSYQSIWKQAVKRHEKIHFRDHDIGGWQSVTKKGKIMENFKCTQCEYETTNKSSLLAHNRRLHETNSNPKRAYERGKYANITIKTTNNGLLQCEHCSYQTAIRTALIKHQSNHFKELK